MHANRKWLAAAVTLVLALTASLGCSTSSGSMSPTSSSGSRSSGTSAPGMKEHTVTISALPTTIDEFLALREKHGTDPFGAAALYVVAQIVYTRDVDLGHAIFTTMIDMEYVDEVGEERGFYQGYRPRNIQVQNWAQRIGVKPWIAASYVAGTTPENKYEIPAGPLTIRIREQANSLQADTAKVFVWSSGADSPRPISLRKNNRGLWKAQEWSSLEVDVRPPVEVKDDDI